VEASVIASSRSLAIFWANTAVVSNNVIPSNVTIDLIIRSPPCLNVARASCA
jgi:hypothetical protein